jgi:plasmid stabilization system protein ParE
VSRPIYSVLFSRRAEADLDRLAEHLLRNARTLEELERAVDILRELRAAVVQQLGTMPWSLRKAGEGSRTTRRELVVPCGATGYVVLYEIEPGQRVLVLALRHQLEQDYH